MPDLPRQPIQSKQAHEDDGRNRQIERKARKKHRHDDDQASSHRTCSIPQSVNIVLTSLLPVNPKRAT